MRPRSAGRSFRENSTAADSGRPLAGHETDLHVRDVAVPRPVSMSLVSNRSTAPAVLDRDRISELLAAVAAFEDLDAGTRADIAEMAIPVTLMDGEALVRQGEPGDAVYVLLSGTFDVVLELDDGAQHTLAQLGAGECVGEMAVLSRSTRTATVMAREAGQVLRLDALSFDALLDRHPAARQHVAAFASRRLPSLRLARSGLFAGLPASELARFDRESNWIRLRGGDTLFQQGDAADDMYVVVRGSLEVLVAGRTGHARLVDVLGPSASIGEMALLTDEPRSATVRAIRDSELVRVPKVEFLRLLEEHPRTAVELSRTLVRRLRQTTAAPRVLRFTRTLALVPAHADGIPLDFSQQLADSLRLADDTVLVLSSADVDAELGVGVAQTASADLANGRLLDWLNEREDRFRYVIYACDTGLTPWTQRCLRQADLVLAVAHAHGDPEPRDVERALARPASSGAAPARYELVLLHESSASRPSGTLRWLHERRTASLAAHHHVRLGHAGDVERLARSIAGASLGLVLSGGGARGFAQIGVMRALEEQELAIDMVGGTSMGAYMAGLYALGHDIATITEVSRKGFVGYQVASDLTMPMVALMRGGSTVKLVQAMFGDVQIEDLWIPYFCVSSNLTRAEVVVHDRGPLWLWARASSAIPGIAPPVPYNGDLLVDGGVLNNLPADIMRERCRGSVIAVDVGAPVELRATPGDDGAELSGWPHLTRALNPLDKRPPFPNILRILSRTATLGSVHDQEAMRDVADLYLHPPTQAVDPLNWKVIDDVVDIGYRDAYDKIAAWKRSDARITGMHSAIRRTATWGI